MNPRKIITGLLLVGEGYSEASYYYSTNTDMATTNIYNGSLTMFETVHNDFKSGDFKNVEKPKMICEIGTGSEFGFEDCDGGYRWMKNAWLTAFSGSAGPALNWYFQWDEGGNNEWEHLKRLKEFTEGIDFNGEDWESHYDIRKSDSLAEMFCLKSNHSEKRALGIISNRTFNYGTVDVNHPCGITSSVPEKYSIPMDVEFSATGNNVLKIDNMGFYGTQFNVEWYNPLTMFQIGSTETYSTGLFGALLLEHPVLSTNSQFPTPLISFRIYEKNQGSFKNMWLYNEQLVQESAENTNLMKSKYNSQNVFINSNFEKRDLYQNKHIQIVPNPTSNKATILLPEMPQNDTQIMVLSNTNLTLFKEKVTGKRHELNTGFLSAGIYLIVIYDSENFLVSRLIKL